MERKKKVCPHCKKPFKNLKWKYVYNLDADCGHCPNCRRNLAVKREVEG